MAYQIKKDPISKIPKVQLAFWLLVRLAMLICAGYSFIHGDTVMGFESIFCFIFTHLWDLFQIFGNPLADRGKALGKFSPIQPWVQIAVKGTFPADGFRLTLNHQIACILTVRRLMEPAAIALPKMRHQKLDRFVQFVQSFAQAVFEFPGQRDHARGVNFHRTIVASQNNARATCVCFRLWT